MSSQQDKITNIRVDINDNKNKIENMQDKMSSELQLVEKNIEAVKTANEVRDTQFSELKESLNNLKADVSTSFRKINTDIDELTDTMTGIANSVNEMLAAKNRFNQNLWKIIFAIVMCFITYFIRGTISEYFENKKNQTPIPHIEESTYLTPKDRELMVKEEENVGE